MVARFRSWWQNIRKPLDAVLITLLVVLITLFVVILLGYILHWDWTGLSQKTLWDWLQLLMIPAVLAVGGYLFTYTTNRNEQRATEQRAQSERDIALDNQRETALQSYIDKLSELLLHEKLGESQPEDEVCKIGRVRTLTVLPRLDNERKKSVLQFLHGSGLIIKGTSIIDLDGADLSRAHLRVANLNGADLSRADLSEAHLSRANLSGAILNEAILSEADLSGADLSGADLSGANLSGADLGGANLTGAIVTPEQLDRAISLQGAIMPDWSTHP